ncbi:hypothetical protein D3C85_849200 [compost metagenome]
MRRLVVAQKIHAINDRDHRIEPRLVAKAATLFVAKGERFRNGQGFRDTGGLDQQIIKAAFPGEAPDFFEQIFTQRTADAAIAHFNELFLRTIKADLALHFTTVDVDFTHVIDDNGNPQVLSVAQHMIKQRAFTRSEKAG